MLVSHASLSRKLKTSLPLVGFLIALWAYEEDATDFCFQRFCVKEKGNNNTDVTGQRGRDSGW